MSRNTLILILGAFIALAGTSGCSKEKNAPPGQDEQKTTAAAQAGHAARDAVPGSHEDWCDEHQVPESQCTRCDPQLIAAFKATGDWCEEHGVPESQCLKCNPDLKIVRPPPGSAPRGK